MTEPIRSSPTATAWYSLDTPASRSAFWSTDSVKTAMMTPGMVPFPPLMSTPPSSTMVTTTSVRPVPLSDRALEKREVRMTPASAAISPDTTKRAVLSRPTRIPA